MKPKKIYIVTDAQMPIGFAATNRILSYVNGFATNGVETEVLVFRKNQVPSNGFNKNTYGDLVGGKFSYLQKTTVKSTSFFKRRIDNFLSPFILFNYVLFNIEKGSLLIYYSPHTMPLLFLYFAKKIKNNIILLKEESEHPTIRKRSKNFISWVLFDKIHYLLFDGFLLMTDNLMSYFEFKYPKMPKCLVPMTVDFARFGKQDVQKEKLVTYVGSLNNRKDGILFLLKAFKEFVKSYKNYRLQVCGFALSLSEKDAFLKEIDTIGLNKLVIFKENVQSIVIPNILSKSSILVLPRPHSIQAENGFPTKLGEYLATGIPVIVTSVGEIPKYLTHKSSAYIIEPGKINEIQNYLEYCAENTDLAIEVGKNGRKVALKSFNNINQTKKIIDFVCNL